METAPAADGVATAPPMTHRRRMSQYRYVLLLTSSFLLLGVQGIAPPGDVQQVVVAALAGSSVLLAFHAAELKQPLLGIATAVAVTAVGLSVLRALEGVDEGAVRGVNALLVAFGPPAVAVGVVRELRKSGRVRVEAVMGVLSLYMLLGMLFAFVFGAMDQLGGEPVFAGGQDATVSRCLYYSFTTLTTVGYGDLTTRSDLGHTLSVFEALLGQIYLVTVVSLIVSNLGRPARRAS